MKRLFLSALLLSLGGCASTEILTAWQRPDANPAALRNLVVVVKTKDESLRRSAEDRIAALFPRRTVTPSYALVPDVSAEDEQLPAYLQSGQYDGAIVLRIASVNREPAWVPGVWQGPYWGFGGWSVYDPGGAMTVETTVRVETNVYQLPQNELIWATTTRTVNPRSVAALVDETIGALQREFRAGVPSQAPVSLR
jgi:hypothetical protein